MNKRGFTLLEIVVASIIIGLIAALAVPRFTASQTRATVSEAIAWINQIHTAMQRCYYEKGTDTTLCLYDSTTGNLLDIGVPRTTGQFNYIVTSQNNAADGTAEYVIKANHKTNGKQIVMAYGREAAMYNPGNPGMCAIAGFTPVGGGTIEWYACDPYHKYLPN